MNVKRPVLRELELKRVKPVAGASGNTGESEKKEEQRTSNDRLKGMKIFFRRPGVSKTANILGSIGQCAMQALSEVIVLTDVS